MKSDISYFLVLIFFPIFLIGQSDNLPIFQVPIHKYTTKDGLATSAINTISIHDSGLIEIIDLKQSNFIAGDQVIPFRNAFFEKFGSFITDIEGGVAYKADQNALLKFDYKDQRCETLFTLKNFNKLYNVSVFTDKVALTYKNLLPSPSYEIKTYSMEGRLIHSLTLSHSENILISFENYLYVQNKETFEVNRISLENGYKEKIGWDFTNAVLLAPIDSKNILLINKGDLLHINLDNQDKTIIQEEFIESDIFYKLSAAYWKNSNYIISFGNKLFVFDLSQKSLTHEIRNQRNQYIAEDITIRDLFIDDSEFLYCQSIRNGVFKCDLKNSHFRINNAPKDAQFAKNVLVDREMGFVLNTNWKNDLVIHDLNGQLLHLIDFDISENFLSLGPYKIRKGVYLLPFEESHDHIILYFDDQTSYRIEKIKSDEASQSSYYSKELLNNAESIVIGTQTQLMSFSKENRTLSFQYFTESYYQAQTSFLLADRLYVQNKHSLNILSFPDIKIIHTIQFLKPYELRDFIQNTDSSLLIAHNEGLLELDLNSLKMSEVSGISDFVYTMEYFKDKLYLGTNDGILVMKDEKIIDKIAMYDEETKSEFNTNAKYLTENALYLGSNSGIVRVTENNEEQNQELRIRPLRVTVNNETEYFLLNEEQLNEVIVLNPGQQNIEIVFTNLSSTIHTKLNYQYSLDDGTSEWIDLKKNNFVNINLRPGKYKLYYGATKFFDKSLPKKSFINLRLKAKWYNTTLFRTLMSSAILITFFLIYLSIQKFRNRQLLDKLILEKKIEQDKNRIAMDLHDNIGVNLSMLKRNIDFLYEFKSDLNESVLDDKLLFLSEVAAEVNTSLRDSIWAVRKEKFSLNEMVERIEKLVFSLELQPEKQLIILENKIDTYNKEFTPSEILMIYRIIQESIHNSIKHSESREIRIILKQDDSGLICQIKDNGIGFDEKIVEKSGLKNMYVRAEHENAILSIDSQVKIGTTVTLKVRNGK